MRLTRSHTQNDTAGSGWPLFDQLPASERAPLAGLTVSEVQAWVRARIDKYRQLVDILVAFHNAIAPIHRAFPPEVLAEVFIQRVALEQSDPMIVAHICRRWRAVALDCPRLWAAVVGS
ncbi:uncharacterized protein BXZ73DRAFT_49699, partial [Epithele typhae]|uniref:uncharacterized protein n=1 Tax=Epithele typhae TaxID=378194 RepID=UPI00200897D9